MFQMFYTNPETNKTLSINTDTIGENFDYKGKWIHLINPTDKEIEFVCNNLKVPEEMIKAALDDEERARIEKDEGWMLTLFDIPTIEEEDGYYSYGSIPLGVMYNDKTIITVCLKRSVVLNDFSAGRIKDFATFKKTKFLLQLLYNTATKFLQYLRQIDKSSQRIQNELNKSMKNKGLTQLLDLENSLVYFSTSLRSNGLVIEKIGRIESKNFHEEDQDLWEDVGIENRQAIEMCQIYSNILSISMDAYSSVISNNLNVVMKRLTIITMILSIPTLLYSMWGMNVKVPWEHEAIGFWIVGAISIVISIIAAIFLFKDKRTK